MRTKKILLLFTLVAALCIAVLLHVRLHREPLINNNPGTQKHPEEKVEEPPEQEEQTKIKVSLKIIEDKIAPPTVKASAQAKTSADKPEKKQAAQAPLKRVVPVTREVVKQGMGMVGTQGEHLGEFPSFTAEYRQTIGVEAYIRLIRRTGGRFFIYETSRKKLVAEIDTAAQRLKHPVRLSELSPRSRDITGEGALLRYVDEAARQHGSSEYSVIILFPLEVDAFLIGAMEESLGSIGKSSRDFFSFRGRYEQQGGSLILRVLSGNLKSGSSLAVDITLNLSSF